MLFCWQIIMDSLLTYHSFISVLKMTASETNFGMTKNMFFIAFRVWFGTLNFDIGRGNFMYCMQVSMMSFIFHWLSHRLESCKTKAAREIRRLRAELQRRHRDNARANPGRKTRKTGKRKLAARKAYAKKNVRRTYEQKRQVDSNKNGNSFRVRASAREDPRA